MDWEEEEDGEEQSDESRMILGLAHQEQWPPKKIKNVSTSVPILEHFSFVMDPNLLTDLDP